MAQRHPLYIFALATLALQGCGKDVEKSGRVEAQVNPGPATVTPVTPQPIPAVTPDPSPLPPGPGTTTVQPSDGSCIDPIGPIAYPIATFADLTRFNTGSWDVDHVVTFTTAHVRAGQADARTATSALEIHPYSNRKFRPICTDMRQMPAGFVTWSTDVPFSIDAVNGDIEQDLVINETVVGPESRVAGQRQLVTVDADCTNMEGSMGGLSAQHCKPVMVYQIDMDHVLIVKTSVEKDGNGNQVTVRTAATYELLGATIPRPSPVPSPRPSPVNPAQTNGVNPAQVGLVR